MTHCSWCFFFSVVAWLRHTPGMGPPCIITLCCIFVKRRNRTGRRRQNNWNVFCLFDLLSFLEAALDYWLTLCKHVGLHKVPGWIMVVYILQMAFVCTQTTQRYSSTSIVGRTVRPLNCATLACQNGLTQQFWFLIFIRSFLSKL